MIKILSYVVLAYAARLPSDKYFKRNFFYIFKEKEEVGERINFPDLQVGVLPAT